MKKFIIAILVIGAILLLGKACSSDDSDDAGAYYDWGDGYYWDTNDHTVKEKPW